MRIKRRLEKLEKRGGGLRYVVSLGAGRQVDILTGQEVKPSAGDVVIAKLGNAEMWGAL